MKINFRTIMIVLLASGFLVVGCAEAPLKVAPVDKSENPTALAKKLGSDIAAAKSDQVDALSPTWFGRAQQSYAQAESGLKKGTALADIRKSIAAGRAQLDQAQKFAKKSRFHLPDVIESRNAAIKANAGQFNKEFASLENDFLEMAEALNEPRPAAAENRPVTTPAVVIFYKYGTMLFETGPLPSPFDKNKELIGFRAGYKCKVFALFFAYFRRWNCKAVAIKGRTNYLDKNKATKQSHRKLIEELNAAIAKKYKPGDMKLNFWEKHGRIVVVLILIGLIVAAILRAKKKKKG